MKQPDQYNPTGQCCELDEPYQAPSGFFDQPFIYVFDADNLIDGTDVLNAGITTFSGADFILRRVAGQDRVCKRFQLRDVLARLVFGSTLGAFTAGFNDFAVVPEILYPAASGITFDMLNVQRSALGSIIAPPIVYFSQIVFQGVRRFQGYKRPPSYPYWEDEFSYVVNVTLGNFAGAGAQPATYAINIYDYDFELLRILEVQTAGKTGANLGFAKIQLYDQVYEKVFSAPVVDALIVDNPAATSSPYHGIVPVPGIVYRIGQQIKFDVYSLLTPSEFSGGFVPVTIQLKFQGVRRRPC